MPTNREYLDRLKAIECPDATAPAAAGAALVLGRGLGSLVYDVENREYIDMCAGFGALALGHNPSAHQAMLQSRVAGPEGMVPPPITHGMGDVYPSRAKVELLELLLSLMPAHLTTAALALTGAQAVELAVKTALLATGRSGFITFAGGYHGLDLGVLPLTAKAAFREPFAGFLARAPVEVLAYGCDDAVLDAAVARLVAQGAGCAAVIVEPVQGRAGVRPAPLAWLAQLRRACDRHDALLIFDEVFTGLGRSGRLTFAASVPCDLLCLGKALGGGFPVSACVGTKAAFSAWPPSAGEALHTGTFFGHPLGCEAALATLAEIAGARLWERAEELGARALQLLREQVGGHPRVREVRGAGLMLAVELHAAGDGVALMESLRACGVIALASGERGEALTLTPALTVPFELLQTAILRLRECLWAPPF